MQLSLYIPRRVANMRSELNAALIDHNKEKSFRPQSTTLSFAIVWRRYVLHVCVMRPEDIIDHCGRSNTVSVSKHLIKILIITQML